MAGTETVRHGRAIDPWFAARQAPGSFAQQSPNTGRGKEAHDGRGRHTPPCPLIYQLLLVDSSLLLPLMRLASGSRQNEQVDQRWMEVAMQMQGPDGLLYYPLVGRPWAKSGVATEQHGGRTPASNQFTEPYVNGRLLGAIALYYRTTGDKRWKQVGKRQ